MQALHWSCNSVLLVKVMDKSRWTDKRTMHCILEPRSEDLKSIQNAPVWRLYNRMHQLCRDLHQTLMHAIYFVAEARTLPFNGSIFHHQSQHDVYRALFFNVTWHNNQHNYRILRDTRLQFFRIANVARVRTHSPTSQNVPKSLGFFQNWELKPSVC